MQQIPTASLPDSDNPAPEPAPEPAAGGPEGSAHDWSLAALLERAVHIAREVAIGDTGIAPVLIALRPGQPPLALFISASHMVIVE